MGGIKHDKNKKYKNKNPAEVKYDVPQNLEWFVLQAYVLV